MTRLRRLFRALLISAAAAVTAVVAVPATAHADPGAACSVSWRISSSYGTGYEMDMTVTNTGSAPTSSWTAGFGFNNFPPDFVTLWNASVTTMVSPMGITIDYFSNLGWNNRIAPGTTATFGFLGRGNVITHLPSGSNCVAT